MAGFQTVVNLFKVLQDTSYRDIEAEATREVTIAIAGNTTELRDRLHRALSSRLESLWTTSPFRLVESGERPTIGQDDETSGGGLLLYVFPNGQRIPTERKEWLRSLALSGKVNVLLITLEKPGDEPFNRSRSSGQNKLNPLRLVPNRETRKVSGPAADGAAFQNSDLNIPAAWQTDLEELLNQSEGRVGLVELRGLEFANLQAELLAEIVQRLPGRELALARRAPVFRNPVANHLILEAARANATTTLLANLSAGVPFLGDIFSSGADFVVLTQKQLQLNHQLAAIYGQKRNSLTEVYLELLPIVAAAFLWKTISGTLVKRFPPFLAMLPKSGIAFAATFLTGWLARFYYSGDRKAPSRAAGFVRGIYERVSGQAETNPTDNEPRKLRSS